MAKKQDRPLSPHLTIYKPQITSVLSITHRATGVFLIFGAFLLSVWIIALAGSSIISYKAVSSFLTNWCGHVLLLAWAFSLFYHLCNGIRHLFWDIGLGLEIKEATASGWVVIIVSLMLTIIAWYTALEQVGVG